MSVPLELAARIRDRLAPEVFGDPVRAAQDRAPQGQDALALDEMVERERRRGSRSCFLAAGSSTTGEEEADGGPHMGRNKTPRVSCLVPKLWNTKLEQDPRCLFV